MKKGLASLGKITYFQDFSIFSDFRGFTLSLQLFDWDFTGIFSGILLGFCRDFTWILQGFYLGFAGILHGFLQGFYLDFTGI